MLLEDFVEQQKKIYKTLKPCFCPAIEETVHFNSEGLKHLLYDNKHRPRNKKEKRYKVSLIDYLIEVITNAKKSKKETFTDPKCNLWILEWVEVKDKNKKKQKVKVILRKIGKGNTHFLSVMKKKNNKK